jgi:hypothetical protein
MTPEPIAHAPRFLAVAGWTTPGGSTLEVASRRRLDTRQVVPYFVRDGAVHVGVLARRRASRAVRGDALAGLEAIAFDLAGVDETADLAAHSDAMFSARAGLAVASDALTVALPAYARSVGYLTELALPVFVPVVPPDGDARAVSWDGGAHEIWFRPAAALLAELGAPGAPPHAEDLALLLRAIDPARC